MMCPVGTWPNGVMESYTPRSKPFSTPGIIAKSSNIQDALIAETAIKNSLTLVSEDSDLLLVVASLAALLSESGQIDPSGSPSEAVRG